MQHGEAVPISKKDYVLRKVLGLVFFELVEHIIYSSIPAVKLVCTFVDENGCLDT